MAIEQAHRTGIPGGRLTGNLTALRAVTATDLPTLKAWDNDPEIIALMGQRFGDNGAQEWFQSASTGRSCRTMAIEAMDGRLIGEVELAHLNWRVGSTELRICIGEKDCWGQGYGSDALALTLHMAFVQYGLRSVYLRVFVTNERAVHLYARTGFRTEAMLQPSTRRGDPAPVLLMVLTRDRWERVQSQRLA